jgi:hypothetical protein
MIHSTVWFVGIIAAARVEVHHRVIVKQTAMSPRGPLFKKEKPTSKFADIRLEFESTVE